MERRHRSKPGRREFRPGRPTVGQTCCRKFPAVTTPAFPHNATESQGSCPQRSGEVLEILQVWLEALLPFRTWIRWEIATSRYNKHWEGIPRILRDQAIYGQTMYPTWLSKNYVSCVVNECETLYHSFIQAPVGTDSDRAASSLLFRLEQKKQERWEEAVKSIDFSHPSHKAWSTINKLTGRSGRYSPCAPSRQTPSLRNLWSTEGDTQDWGARVYQARQQGAVQPMQGPNTRGSQYLWTLLVKRSLMLPPSGA